MIYLVYIFAIIAFSIIIRPADAAEYGDRCNVAKEGEDVIACDMSNVPLNDQEVDAVVFSLSF